MKAKIIRPDFYSGDKIVKMKATVTEGEITKEQIFDFLVRKADRTDDQALAEDEKYIRANVPLKIREDVPVMKKDKLPAGSTVVWSVVPAKAITANGEVTRPDFGLPSETVAITAKLTNGEKTKEVVVDAMVMSLTEEDEITSAAKMITWELIKNKNMDKARVTTDLTFPEKVDEIPVQWSTSNSNYVGLTGKVTRPEYSEADVQVTVTATLTKGDKRTVVTITGLKVLKKSASSQQRVDEYVKTPDKWVHWITANGTNNNKGLNTIKESFILPAEQDDMMLTWSVVNSAGEPTEISYFKIAYQDDTESGVVNQDIGQFAGNRRYVATIVRPSTNTVQVSMKATAEISETEVDSVQVPGGNASMVHQLTILGEDQDIPAVAAAPPAPAVAFAKSEENIGRATWSAPLHQELNKVCVGEVCTYEPVEAETLEEKPQ